MTNTGPLDAMGIAQLNRAAESLWLAAQAQWPTLSIEVLPRTESTNAYALSLGRAGACEPTVVVAWAQTAGKGRSGRQWTAPSGLSLTLSLGLPMDLGAVPGGGALSLAVGVMVAQALNQLFEQAELPPAVQLKWPNDLWAPPHKLGGILIEAIASPALPANQRWVVIGLGLNLAGPPEPGLDARTDLARLGLDRPPLTPAQAMLAVVPALLEGLSEFSQQGFAPFKARFGVLDALADQRVALWRHGWSANHPADVHGQALGVNDQGALLIHDDQGHTTAWTVGEVSVRVQAHPL